MLLCLKLLCEKFLSTWQKKSRAARDSAVSTHKMAADHGLADIHAPFVAGDVDLKAVTRARLDRFLKGIGAKINCFLPSDSPAGFSIGTSKLTIRESSDQ